MNNQEWFSKRNKEELTYMRHDFEFNSEADATAGAIHKSDIFCSVIKSANKPARFALQIGLAILMDKPIILLVDKSKKEVLSKQLIKIARMIQYVDMNDEREMIIAQRKIEQFTEEFGNG